MYTCWIKWWNQRRDYLYLTEKFKHKPFKDAVHLFETYEFCPFFFQKVFNKIYFIKIKAVIFLIPDLDNMWLWQQEAEKKAVSHVKIYFTLWWWLGHWWKTKYMLDMKWTKEKNVYFWDQQSFEILFLYNKKLNRSLENGCSQLNFPQLFSTFDNLNVFVWHLNTPLLYLSLAPFTNIYFLNDQLSGVKCLACLYGKRSHKHTQHTLIRFHCFQ